MILLVALALGIFEGHGDIGAVLHAGSAEYADGHYTVSGSGENMWFATDGLHYVWKRISAHDVTLTADVLIRGQGGDPHRKAVLMIRQTLDADSAYADVALHGDGLTSLQARAEKGAATHEIQAAVSAPKRLRITKRGDHFFIAVASEGEDLRLAGGWMTVPMQEPFYVGLGVCAHNKDAIETAVFSNVELDTAPRKGKPVTYWTLETMVIASTDRRAVYLTRDRIKDPAWAVDGSALIFKSGRRVLRVPASGGQAQVIGRHNGPNEDGRLDADSLGPWPAGITIEERDTTGGFSWSPDKRRIAFVTSQFVVR